MANLDKSKRLLQRMSTVGFSFYGMYCIVVQSAYFPASPSPHLYVRMEGTHAIAFGASLLLIVASGSVARRSRGNGGTDHAAWMIRGIGMAIAVPLGWYAFWGGTWVG